MTSAEHCKIDSHRFLTFACVIQRQMSAGPAVVCRQPHTGETTLELFCSSLVPTACIYVLKSSSPNTWCTYLKESAPTNASLSEMNSQTLSFQSLSPQKMMCNVCVISGFIWPRIKPQGVLEAFDPCEISV